MPKIFLLRHALDQQSLSIQRSAKSVQNEDIDELQGDMIAPGSGVGAPSPHLITPRDKAPSPGLISPPIISSVPDSSDSQDKEGPLELVKTGSPADKCSTPPGPRAGFRTLAARKAYDEPIDISIERKANESRYPDQAESPVSDFLNQDDKPVNLVVPKRPHWNQHNALAGSAKVLPPPPSIKQMVPLSAPSLGPPPANMRQVVTPWQKLQDQPVDFSTKRPLFTAAVSPSRSQPPKHQEVPSHHRRPPPAHPRRVLPSREAIFHRNLLVLILRKIRDNPEQGRAIVRMLMHVCRLQAHGCPGNTAPPPMGSGQDAASIRAASGGGSGRTHSSGGQGGGAANYSGYSGGNGAGSTSSGGSSTGGGSPHSVRSNSTENDDALFDPSLEFASIDFDLPATRKWLNENPDFNPLKILDNISLKSAFSNSGAVESVPKPPPDSSIDRDTANILQLAVPVPDPSATFLDIGTDFGPMSMYEDDPFNLEQVNPSNFILPETNSSPLQPSMTSTNSLSSSQSGLTFEQLKPAAVLLPHPLSGRLHPHIDHHSLQSAQPGGYASLMSATDASTHSLYGGHMSGQGQPQIKMEPVFIKEEPVGHHMGAMQGHHGSPSYLADPLNDMSPLSPIDRLPATPGKGRKRSYSISEEEDLTNVPSLQMRIQILQQRFGIPKDAPLELINGGHGIKNPMASDSPDRIEKLPPIRSDNDPNKMACRVCGKAFTLQRLLNRHMKCHSDTKRYLCTFCGKGFNDTFDLKRHTRTHTGVRPYKCNLCEKSFTQRCSLESHCLKVHGVAHNYEYKQRRSKVYVCEDCGHTTKEPEVHYVHLKETHPYSPALMKFYDKRHFKFANNNFTNMLLTCN
jgi:hypothetical protein